MTRARNRRRRVPLHPSTTGSFHPINVDSNGADCKTNGSAQKGDSIPTGDHHSQQPANAGNQRLEDPRIGKKDVNGRQSQDNTSPMCPHHHNHHHHHQREGKDGSDRRKTLVSKHQVAEDGKSPSKPQEFTPYMAARAKELKEEGNRLFQKKDYSSAMDQYELALKLTPPNHPERAIFHSNRAACLMQMKPVKYEDAIHECNLALHAHPGFPRALLRRARAFEATGELELALEDVELLLQGDVSHPDAVEMARRIRFCMENEGNEAQQCDQGMVPTPIPPSDVKAYAEMPANARVESRDVPCVSIPVCNEEAEVNTYKEDDDGTVLTPVASSRQMQKPPKPSVQQTRFQPMSHPSPNEALPHSPPREDSPMTAPFNDTSDASNTPSSDPCKLEFLKKVIHQDSIQILQLNDDKTPHMRPLKLIYDHDIRLAEMPVDCKFGDLRKLVRERFPSSKSILIKYKDAEGDLVTITSTQDLRLAEAAAAIENASRSFRMASIDAFSQGQHKEESAIGMPVVPSTLDQLRLHVMEVPADQEPHDKEEISIEKAEAFAVGKTESLDSKLAVDGEAKLKGKEDFEKWFLDFAQLFRAHLGIDPNGQIDLHERGMELCAEALEEVASTEEAHKLLDLAANKFQEMAALGFLNWANVYMCAARKQLPHDDSEDSEMDFCDRLQAAFDWAQAQYALAEQKLVESIRVKPDFCDAMLSLGQKDFESAKLHWSLAIAKQIDLSSWDSFEMLKLFEKAERTMQEAADLLQKQEWNTKGIESSAAEMVGGGQSQGSSTFDQAKSAFGQDVAMKSQVYLFWGNILYEHSQVVFRLGFPSWKELLDAAVEKFEVAGASPLDVSTALEKHLSNSMVFMDANERLVQKEGLDNERDKIVATDETATNVVVCDLSDEDDGKDSKDTVTDENQSCDEKDMARDEDESKDGRTWEGMRSLLTEDLPAAEEAL